MFLNHHHNIVFTVLCDACYVLEIWIIYFVMEQKHLERLRLHFRGVFIFSFEIKVKIRIWARIKEMDRGDLGGLYTLWVRFEIKMMQGIYENRNPFIGFKRDRYILGKRYISTQSWFLIHSAIVAWLNFNLSRQANCKNPYSWAPKIYYFIQDIVGFVRFH